MKPSTWPLPFRAVKATCGFLAGPTWCSRWNSPPFPRFRPIRQPDRPRPPGRKAHGRSAVPVQAGQAPGAAHGRERLSLRRADVEAGRQPSHAR